MPLAPIRMRGLPAASLMSERPLAGRHRAALSTLFPRERLVVPSGNLKIRSNVAHYPFRPYSGYVRLTGDQARDGALVLEPRPGGGHDARRDLER